MFDRIRKFLKKYKVLFIIIKFVTTPLQHLRRKLQVINMVKSFNIAYKKSNHSANSIFYLGLPEHDNLGDIGQAYCISNWIEENYLDYNFYKLRTRIISDSKMIHLLKTIVERDDIFIFQSGYCTRDGNGDHIMHKTIAKMFPHNKLVMLPQSVSLVSKDEIKETKEIYSKCDRLLFISRDLTSFEKAKEIVGDKLYCFPDIVTSLIGRLNINVDHRNGVLLCMRNDDEKYYSDGEIAGLFDKLRGYFENVDVCDTNSKYSIEETYNNLENVIREMVTFFAQYEIVITDRFHGTIFSLTANTPVIVIKTNDHKVIAGLSWFDSFDNNAVQYADSLEEALMKAKYITDSRIRVHNPDILYQQFYKNNLFDLVSNL